MPLVVLVLGVLGGCGKAHPLAEVPIVGGTAEQQRQVRAALVQFDEAVGPGRVLLGSVHIQPMREREDGSVSGGEYNSALRRINLNEELPTFAGTVWHELCHALNHEEDVVRDPDPLIDELARGLFDPSYADSPIHGRPGRFDREERRSSETLASFCGPGPLAAAVMATGEPDAIATRTGEWLSNHVWTAFTLDVQPLDRSNQVSWEPGAEIAAFEVHPTADPGILYVTATLGLNVDPDEVHLDLYTGAEVGSDLPPEASAAGQPPLALAGRGSAAGWEDGPAGLAAWWSLEHLGRSDTHLFAFRDGGWRWVPERAGDPDQVVFTADDQVWVGWSEGRVLRWSPLGAR